MLLLRTHFWQIFKNRLKYLGVGQVSQYYSAYSAPVPQYLEETKQIVLLDTCRVDKTVWWAMQGDLPVDKTCV